MIITRLSGGMGNQMFQYALGRVLALKHHTILKIDTTFLENQTPILMLGRNFTSRPYALEVFQIESLIADKYDIPWYSRPFFSGVIMQSIDAFLRKVAIFPGWEKYYAVFDQEILTLGADTYLCGFWHSPKYFQGYEDVIRKDFTLRQITPSLQSYGEKIKAVQSVGIHVRRGDFLHNSLYTILDEHYYESGLKIIREQVSIETLYIFSDDIDWCRAHLKFPHQTVYVSTEYAGSHGEGHLYLMQQCRHFIISNSTFAWWAAWLSISPDKIIITPRQWLNDSRLAPTDLIPDNWIRI